MPSIAGAITNFFRAGVAPRQRADSGRLRTTTLPSRSGLRNTLCARYDAAATTLDNYKHWANADGLSANAAASPEVRQRLRNRSRYETANNSYAKGIVLTEANDTIGTGPRLQVLTDDSAANTRIERHFHQWARAVRLAEKLRTMKMAKSVDGEAFALLTTNPRLDHPIQLDLRLIEADQVTSPDLTFTSKNMVDGIRLDQHGNPAEYHVLRHHPGSDTLDAASALSRYDPVPADQVLHVFRVDRPGQQRGIPELTPALPLFAQLRRFTLAVIASAESVAEFNAVLQTRQGADLEETEAPEVYDQVELTQRMATVLPDGYELSQIRAEQPATTYDMFVRMILKEVARCLNMPFNVAAGDSSDYNYASGRLDHQTYFKSIEVERSHWAHTLDRILMAWLDEAALIPGLLPDGLGPFSDLSHQWFFDGHEHVDPVKEANADKIRLETNRDTLARQYAKEGLDWEAELRQRAKEKQLIRELGLGGEDVLPQRSSNKESTHADSFDNSKPQPSTAGQAA